MENGIGSGRHNAEDLAGTGLGTLYTTSDLQKAAQYGTLFKKGKGRYISDKGGVGKIILKDANFSGNREDWITNNPIPTLLSKGDSYDTYQLGNNVIRRVHTNDNYPTYIFIGNPQTSIGKYELLPTEDIQKLIKTTYKVTPTFEVARWKLGGKFTPKKSQLVKNAEELNSKRDMRKKLIKGTS